MKCGVAEIEDGGFLGPGDLYLYPEWQADITHTDLADEVDDAHNQSGPRLIHADQQAVVHHSQAGQEGRVAPQRPQQPGMRLTAHLPSHAVQLSPRTAMLMLIRSPRSSFVSISYVWRRVIR